MDDAIRKLLEDKPYRIILGNPVSKEISYKKIVLSKKEAGFQAEKFTETQVFHENLKEDELISYIKKQLGSSFSQLDGFGGAYQSHIKISRKGKVFFTRSVQQGKPAEIKEHNRKKKYLLEEGTVILPLVDMGIFTREGRVVKAMYDKFRQINRFVELVDDTLKNTEKKELTVIDFGCGKSYLTFILYYYFTVIRKIKVRMTGLDLKADVIEKCNQAAKKYGYEGLSFELGDINGYQCDFPVDMVITLHACDTATDYALYHAIRWNSEMIFSVPCCQHELNAQMESDVFSLFTRYGIIKERLAALMTDAIRGNLLEYSGYKTQLLEFVDFTHTPKNILIRAVKARLPEEKRREALEEARRVMEELQLDPMLYRLLFNGQEK